MKNVLLLIALSAAPLAATFTSCQTTSKSSSVDQFAKTDADHDGKIGPNEASDYFVDIMFASRDSNHDGKLTWEEWHVPGEGASKGRFNAADKDKDGSLSRAEALAYGRERGVFRQNFRSADTNHDGS